jgi:hypothetical protein
MKVPANFNFEVRGQFLETQKSRLFVRRLLPQGARAPATPLPPFGRPVPVGTPSRFPPLTDSFLLVSR